MLEIVALAPENEMRVAERLRDSIASEWRDLGDSSTDRVRVFVGARMLFDVDLLVEVSLARPRPVLAQRMRDATTAPPGSILCGLLAIEVKQQSRDRFEVAGTEIFPIYGRAASRRSVAKQVGDAVIAVDNFARRYGNERIFVHGLAWLTDVPEADLKPMPDYIAGREATWSSLLQAAATRSAVLFSEPTPRYRSALATIGDVLARRQRLVPRDRAAVDRLTNAAIADGKLDAVREAVGSRQIRLAGRAGSGKSTTLALLAEHVARVRQERLLVLTYHHALCHEIERLIRSIVNDDALVDSKVRVTTLVDFLADACSELGADVPRVDGQIDYSHIDDALRSFLRAMPPDERRAEAEILQALEPDRFGFDYICIDEAQDCLDAERDVLRVLYPANRIVLADGIDQLVRRQTPCDWTAGLPSGARLHVDLSRSLRMSYNVAAFATAVAREMDCAGWRVVPHPELSGGRIVVQTGRYDVLLGELARSLDDAGLPRKDLLVCVPPREVTTESGRRFSQVGGALEALGYESWNGCDEIVRRMEIATPEQVRIVQYDSMRGLEGWCTLLIGLDAFYQHRLAHPNLHAGDRSTPEDVAKRWILMALTRAASTLAITLDDPDSEVAQWLRRASASLRDVVEWRDDPP